MMFIALANADIIIIIIERKDLGGVMSERLQGHLTTLKQFQNASATQSDNIVNMSTIEINKAKSLNWTRP